MSNKAVISYISYREQPCGVYQFGFRIGAALSGSTEFDFRYRECGNESDLLRVVREERPSAIIYNYHPATLPWVVPSLTRRIRVPQIGTIHEVTQAVADQADNHLFDYHVAPDPTLLLKNPLVFKTGRLVASYVNRFPHPEKSTIGSFGFGTDGKGLEYMISCVQECFDVARLRLHMPAARFGDPDGLNARAIVARCHNLIYKPGITLEATHEFLDEQRLLDFLAQNSCNVFTYNRADGRGISSVADYALAVQRPMAIRRTNMMRHLWDAIPSICLEEQSLAEIIASGTRPIADYAIQWCPANLIWDYERIIRTVLANPRPLVLPGGVLFNRVARRAIRGFRRRILGQPPLQQSTQWVSDTGVTTDTWAWRTWETYNPITLGSDDRLNRILDNGARALYIAIINKLFKMLPDLMARKIPEANVQQAFALDTIIRLVGVKGTDARLLCVGSFEDSCVWGLKRLGFRIEEVDPVLNYDLGQFVQRPTTRPASYDLVFSISVIEHVPDDETFLMQIASLLKPGGYAVITCDFQDTYRPGDHKPQCDCRLYTQKDLRDRLLARIPECELVDEPLWDCPAPDFQWENCQYTFATFVVRKREPSQPTRQEE